MPILGPDLDWLVEAIRVEADTLSQLLDLDDGGHARHEVRGVLLR